MRSLPCVSSLRIAWAEPCWSQTITVPYDPGYLSKDPVEVLWFLSMNIERLYRIAQTPMDEIGQDLWMQTFLAVCRHLAQLYEQLRRRYKAARARAMAWERLQRFLTWEGEEEVRAVSLAPDPAPPQPAGTPAVQVPSPQPQPAGTPAVQVPPSPFDSLSTGGEGRSEALLFAQPQHLLHAQAAEDYKRGA